jgi:hypothetical protein
MSLSKIYSATFARLLKNEQSGSLDFIWFQDFQIMGKAGKIVRLVRVMRIMRIFKLVRHFAGLQSLIYTLNQVRLRNIHNFHLPLISIISLKFYTLNQVRLRNVFHFHLRPISIIRLKSQLGSIS